VFEIGTHVIIPHPMRAGLNIGLNFWYGLIFKNHFVFFP
jgi:hypothetical protein